MKIKSLCKYKLNLIYKSKLTYGIYLLQIFFLIIYPVIRGTGDVGSCIALLKEEFYLWFIFIPTTIIMHRESIFKIYYNYLSRIRNLKKMIAVDFISIAVSTFVTAVIVTSFPILIVCIGINSSINAMVLINVGFLIVRYTLLGVFIQYIVYTLLLVSSKIQRLNSGICVLPFLLFIILYLPFDFLIANDRYIPYLDFSAGKYYEFEAGKSIAVSNVLLTNIHLMGYLIMVIWASMYLISKRGVFEEGQDNVN